MQNTNGNTSCGQFCLTGCLDSDDMKGSFYGYPIGSGCRNLDEFISLLQARLQSCDSGSIHLIIIPNLLTPGIHAWDDCCPRAVLRFLAQLRALLRQYSTTAAAITTLSTSLYPRLSGITRWAEILADSVVELTPSQQHPSEAELVGSSNNFISGVAEGLLSTHKLAIYHEMGTSRKGTNVTLGHFAFRVRASGMEILPYTLPPIENEVRMPSVSVTKQALDF